MWGESKGDKKTRVGHSRTAEEKGGNIWEVKG